MFEDQDLVERILEECLGETVITKELKLVAAGNINQGIFAQTNRGDFFLKTNFASTSEIFEKEAAGLELLRKYTSLRIPAIWGFGRIDDQNYLVLEWIENGSRSSRYWDELGVGLAELHAATNTSFGLSHDNFIASLPQKNQMKGNWPSFFVAHRLEPLIGQALYEGAVDLQFMKKFQSIYPKLDTIFPKEKPSLLHGDLWSGNVLVDRQGTPVLLDPAVYFGHREMDLSFSKLFGGFSDRFYSRYEEVFPLEPGFESRVPIYNLYPLLVHLLLFGKSYLPPIQKTVRNLAD